MTGRIRCIVLLERCDPFQVNSAFPMHTSRNDGNLTINGLAKIDYGVYECIATNKYTSIITSTLVIIESEYIGF